MTKSKKNKPALEPTPEPQKEKPAQKDTSAKKALPCDNKKCDGEMELRGAQYVCDECGWVTSHNHKKHGAL